MSEYFKIVLMLAMGLGMAINSSASELQQSSKSKNPFIETTIEGGGSLDGGGGNLKAAEFFAELYAVFNKLSLVTNQPYQKELTIIREKVSQVNVDTSVKDLFLNGNPVDAINYPSENRIVFSIKSWDGFSQFKKRKLAVHEMLGLNTISDPGYELSQRIVSDAELAHSSAIKIDKSNLLDVEHTIKKLPLKGVFGEVSEIHYLTLHLHDGKTFTYIEEITTVPHFGGYWVTEFSTILSEIKSGYVGKERIVVSEQCNPDGSCNRQYEWASFEYAVYGVMSDQGQFMEMKIEKEYQ